MADQLVTLALDEKEYMDGIRRVMKQSQGEFKRMQANVALPLRTLSRVAVGGVGINLAYRMISRSLEEYAKTSGEARREVDKLTKSTDDLYATIGGGVVSLARRTGFGEWLERQSVNVKAMGDELGAALSAGFFTTDGEYEKKRDQLRAERETSERTAEVEKLRAVRIDKEMRLLASQDDYLRAIGATKMADEAAVMRQFLASTRELREMSKLGTILPEDMADGIAAAERLRDAKLARVQVESRDRADKDWQEQNEAWMERESEATREALEAAQDRADSIKSLARDEERMRLEILQAKGDQVGFEREALRQRRERALQDIRTNEALSEAERQAAEARIQSQYDTLEGLGGAGRSRSPLAAIVGGTAGLGSVITGTFGRDVMGGRSGANSAIEKVRSATERSAESNARTVQLLQHIATKLGPAVYG